MFGENNFVSLITIQTTTGFKADYIGNVSDFLLWYAKDKEIGKYRPPLYRKDFKLGEGNARWLMFEDGSHRGVTAEEARVRTVPEEAAPYQPDNLLSQGRAAGPQPFSFRGKSYDTWEKNSHWKANFPVGMERLLRAGRIHDAANSIRFVRYHTDFQLGVHSNVWTDTSTGNFTAAKVFVVQTNEKIVQRCILMATDPGDLVLDPTCGSGTTAYVAEQWGRRWITIDTSRVALALARARVMGARYPYYLLADSPEGQAKEAEISRQPASTQPTHGDIRQGFIYERVPHITLKSIANNPEIDLIFDRFQPEVEDALAEINRSLSGHDVAHRVTTGVRKGEEIHFDAEPAEAALPSGDAVRANELLEWEVPRKAPSDWPNAAAEALERFWNVRLTQKRDIQSSVAAHTDVEYL